MFVPRRWLGCELSLPRIRRSPCETDSAAKKRGRKGTVELMAGARVRQAARGARGMEAVHAAKGPCTCARGATVRTSGDR
jgi:hypothetical protein